MKVTWDSKDLDRDIMKLIGRVDDKALKSATNKAATPLKKAITPMIPVRTGNLKKSIGKKSKAYKDAGVTDAALTIVGPRMSKKFKGFHGWIWDQGFIHWITKKRIPGANVFWSATRSAESQVKTTLQREVLKRIHGK